LKNHGVVHISFIRPPSMIRASKGLAAFAIGFATAVPNPRDRHGSNAAKEYQE
jgi:hypothetical protein